MHSEKLRILYVDGRKDSMAAASMLGKHELDCEVLRHNPHHFWNAHNRPTPAPVLVAPEGRFRGLSAITQYVKLYG